MRRLLLLAACSHPAATTVENGGGVAVPAHDAAVFLDMGGQQAAILGCSVHGALSGDAGACTALIAGDHEARDGLGRHVTLGAKIRWGCEDSDDEDGIAITTAGALPPNYESDDVFDARTQVIVWPSLVAKTMALAKGGDATDLDRAAADALMKQLATDATPLSTVEVKGEIRADLDGDGRIDRAWGVDAQPDADFGERAIIASLSTRPGLVALVVGQDHMAPMAALDLDGDGKAELLWSDVYYEGAGVTLGRFDGKAMTTVGAYGCGE